MNDDQSTGLFFLFVFVAALLIGGCVRGAHDRQMAVDAGGGFWISDKYGDDTWHWGPPPKP